MEAAKVSKKLLARLPVYLEYLKNMPEDSLNVSATVIAKALELGEVQVRKDLAKVSSGGRRRTGRSRQQLIQDIEAYLAYTAETGAILVGTGNLGLALLDYSGFENSGVNLMAGFDISPSVDMTRGGKPIYPMNRLETFCKHYDVHIGVITVPAENAQRVCNLLIACGIKAIWNFAPVQLNTPEQVVVHNENLADSFSSLHLHLKNSLSE